MVEPQGRRNQQISFDSSPQPHFGKTLIEGGTLSRPKLTGDGRRSPPMPPDLHRAHGARRAIDGPRDPRRHIGVLRRRFRAVLRGSWRLPPAIAHSGLPPLPRTRSGTASRIQGPPGSDSSTCRPRAESMHCQASPALQRPDRRTDSARQSQTSHLASRLQRAGPCT
jgi:hypothetical protein